MNSEISSNTTTPIDPAVIPISPDNPKVSIITSVFNGRQYLEEYERYVESQSFQDYELIMVVDTRSDDGTLEEVRRYCSVNDKARCLLQEGPGRLGGSKNIGMDDARGDYLWFLDVDDAPSLDFLARMVEAKESTGSDVAICNFVYVDERVPPTEERGDVIVMSGKTALHARSLNLVPVTSWSMLYDREHQREIGLRFREMMSEDIAFTYIYLDLSERVCFITEPLYGYVIHRNSFCANRMDERGYTELDSYNYLSEYFPKSDTYLQSRMCAIVLRSLVHMTPKGLKKAIRDPTLEANVMRYLGFSGRLEYRLARIFPTVYQWGGSWYIRRFYHRIGNVYVDASKMRTLRSVVESEADD